MTKNQLKAKYAEYLATPSRCIKDVCARPSTNKIRAEYRIIDYLVDQKRLRLPGYVIQYQILHRRLYNPK